MAAVRRQLRRALPTLLGLVLCALWGDARPGLGQAPYDPSSGNAFSSDDLSGGTVAGQFGPTGSVDYEAIPQSVPDEGSRYEQIPPGNDFGNRYDAPPAGPDLSPADGAPPPYEVIPPGAESSLPGDPGRPGRSGPPPDGTADILDVRVVGNRAVTPEKFMRMIRTRPGRTYERKLVEDDVLALLKSRKFVNVTTLYERPETGGIIIIFEVVERPTIEYVRYVGAVKVKPKKLKKETGLQNGDPMDPSVVKDGARKIEEYYRSKGFNDVRVTIIQGTRYDDRGVEYLINEGQMQRIRWVNFVGNDIASEARLKTQIKSKPPLLYLFKGFVDQETLDADVERIQAYYHDLGFFRVRIGREIAFNDAGTWATLTFVIDEGPRYVVRNITFNGNKRYSEDAWREKLDLKPGQYFDRGYAVQDQTLIQDYYGGRGHIFANVLPDLRFLEEPGQLDLVYQIEEGPRYRVGRIDVRIEGEHPHTRNNVALNRLDLRPGDIVDTRKIRDAERRLKATGVFANNPQQGQVPKIVLIPPEEGDTRTAKRSNQNNVRGQSPDNEPGDQLIDVGLDGMPFVPAEQAKPPAQPPQSPTSRTPGVVRGQSPDNVAVPNGVYASPVPAAALSTRGRAGRAADNTRQPAAAPVRPGAGRAMPAPPSQAGQPPIIRGQNQFAPGSGGGLAELPPSTRPPAYPATGQPVVNSPAYEPYVETVPPGGAVATDGPVEPIGGGVLEDPNVVDPNGEIFGEPPDRFIDPTIVVTETQTGRLMFGVGVNSDAGVVGNIVLDEQNFDWRRVPTSWEDIRNATAFRGAGQQFRIEAVPGTQLQRYVINFREPYLLDTPISLGLSGYFYTRFFNEWSEQRLGGRISLGYQLTPDLSATVAFRGEQVKIFNAAGGGAVPGTPQEIVDAQGTNALYGIRGQIAHDTRDSAFLPTEGHYVELGYEQVFGSFLFPVGTIEGRQYFLIHQRPDRSGRHVLSFSAKAGFSSSNTPVYEKFYAGGFSTLRGFRFRGASPVDPLTGIAVGGNFEFIGSVEYMVPLSADDALRAVVFCDYGTVQQSVKWDPDSFRVAPGFGLRITVPGMGPAPIALDLAFPVAKAQGDSVQYFSFFVGLLR